MTKSKNSKKVTFGCRRTCRIVSFLMVSSSFVLIHLNIYSYVRTCNCRICLSDHPFTQLNKSEPSSLTAYVCGSHMSKFMSTWTSILTIMISQRNCMHHRIENYLHDFQTQKTQVRNNAWTTNDNKTGWPSGLRRWIKAPISSGAWVRIPLQSRFWTDDQFPMASVSSGWA